MDNRTTNNIDEYLTDKDLVPLARYKQKMKYKWLTFIKNCSFFIVPYKKLHIYGSNQFTLYHNRGDEIVIFKSHTLKIRHAPIITSYLLKGEYPENIIKINNGELYLPATRIEKYLYANKDFVTGKLRPFGQKIMPELSPGRIRLFGHNYIYIKKNFDYL